MHKNLQSGARRQALRISMGAVFMLLTLNGLNAGTLWNNGSLVTPNSNNYPCDAGCSSGTSFTVFDNFTVPASGVGWVVTGFDYTDLFTGGISTSEYKSTTWSLWQGDPLSGGKLLGSSATISSAFALGTATSGCLNVSGSCTTVPIIVTFSNSSVYLAPGNTYYLGTMNVMGSSNDGSFRAFSSGGNTTSFGGTSVAQWEQSNGSTTGAIGSTWTSGGNNKVCTGGCSGGSSSDFTAFDIQGVLSPEPGTLTLFGLALGGLFYMRQRSKAS